MLYTDIQGWFDYQAVYDQALHDHPRGVFVEVGAWKGRSTAYLASQTRHRPIHLFVVDTWKGSGGADRTSDESTDPLLRAHGGDMFEHFLENMEGCGVLQSLVPLRMRSVQAAKLFADESVDFCFLDAAHDYSSVMTDLATWYPKVKHGGTIAGHDYNPGWPGVVRAVIEFFGPKGPIAIIGTSWHHTKN